MRGFLRCNVNAPLLKFACNALPDLPACLVCVHSVSHGRVHLYGHSYLLRRLAAAECIANRSFDEVPKLPFWRYVLAAGFANADD